MKQIVVTDLDGTLLSSDRSVSVRNRGMLRKLGHHGILRVICTGRSQYSINRVLGSQIEIDYIIFSSGSGIYETKRKKIVHAVHFTEEQSYEVVSILVKQKRDFMIHVEIPNNHRFFYWYHTKSNSDFEKRISLYRDFAEPWDGNDLPKKVTQFIVIEPPTAEPDVAIRNIRESSMRTEIIRTTSPLDGVSLWIELFPESVNKASGIAWIAKELGQKKTHVWAIGNDYNDVSLLNWVGHPFVVSNAPEELKKKYTVVSSNDDCGFSEFADRVLAHSRE